LRGVNLVLAECRWIGIRSLKAGHGAAKWHEVRIGLKIPAGHRTPSCSATSLRNRYLRLPRFIRESRQSQPGFRDCNVP
jgi:hypothetical protein